MLVTHNLSILPEVDLVVVMTKGEIVEKGTYQQLMDNQGVMMEFVTTYTQTHRDGKFTLQPFNRQSQIYSVFPIFITLLSTTFQTF